MMPHHIIKRPLINEKATKMRQEKKDSKKYCFVVDRKANKFQIKQAIEEFFKVKVVKINTMIQHGKRRRVRFRPGLRPDWKKAMVTLAPGQTIGFFEGI
ncbi:MAG: 50S ribosomal protein L23 [bacterium]